MSLSVSPFNTVRVEVLVAKSSQAHGDPRFFVAHQVPLSMEFSSKNIGVGSLSFFRDLPHPGVKPRSHTWQADSLLSEPPELNIYNTLKNLW